MIFAGKDEIQHITPEDEKRTSKGMSWLSVTEQQAKELRERRGNTLLDSHNSRKRKIKDIKASFEACKSHPLHETNKKLHPEAHDIFGDVDELLRQRKLGLERISRYDDSGEGKERRLEDEFEPTIL
uniref:Uncharacterized protein n=1 Tax=Lactuca sativa TaxID=4236 RepID=A0A9R1WRA1_LACSA|nr:hypothetical protein LSAT_V11C100006060 [Lactuca sativa]